MTKFEETIDASGEIEAVTLLVYASKKLKDFYKYEPVLLETALNLSKKNIEKLLMAYNVFHSHRIFEEIDLFEKSIILMNNRFVNYNVTGQDVTVAELSWGVAQIRVVDPLSRFSNDVLSYIAVNLYEEGFIKVPNRLKKEKSYQNVKIQTQLDKLLAPNHLKNAMVEKAENFKHKLVEDYIKEKKDNLIKEMKEVLKHV